MSEASQTKVFLRKINREIGEHEYSIKFYADIKENIIILYAQEENDGGKINSFKLNYDLNGIKTHTILSYILLKMKQVGHNHSAEDKECKIREMTKKMYMPFIERMVD